MFSSWFDSGNITYPVSTESYYMYWYYRNNLLCVCQVEGKVCLVHSIIVTVGILYILTV